MNLFLHGTQRTYQAVREYLCGYIGRVKATYNVMLLRRRPSPCIQVLESPMPTRTPRTPRTTPAQRRGGMRRSIPRLRRYRVLYNPRQQGECGYDCLLKIMKRRTTPSERRSIRRTAAYCIMVAYEQDRTILGHPVRHLVHSLEMTSYEYGQAIRQGLWASPMDLALLAEYYGTSPSRQERRSLCTMIMSFLPCSFSLPGVGLPLPFCLSSSLSLSLLHASFPLFSTQGMVRIQNETGTRSERDTNLHKLRP